MCGLAGFFDPHRRIDPARYDAIVGTMADRVRHRGPDDSGVWSDGAAGIALGFRRLAIIDLTAAGHQPMVSACGTFVTVFNGEIYNFEALRAELGPQTWRGHSDTEVLLAAVARWGFTATLQRLNGMFAIALWDRRDRSLWLARDRFGEKPLYYGTSKGVVLFGSELKALKAHPSWDGTFDRRALTAYLSLAYVPAPDSAYEGIGKLPQGHYLKIDSDGRIGTPRPYWSVREAARDAAARPFAGSFAAAVDRLETLIDDAVAMRMVADVPVGAFLSGGIDSSTVVAAMVRAQPGAVESFCIGFPGTPYDESQHAEAVARHLGTRHTTMNVSEAECLAVLPRLPEIYDEPFADPSEIPTLVLSELTRRHVTVALSGDGGDEFFGGYERYRGAAAEWRLLERRPPLLGAAARGVTTMLAGKTGHLARRLRKLSEKAGHASALSLYRDVMSRWRAADRVAFEPQWSASDFDEPLPDAASLEQSFMLLDATTWLPDDLMVKVDRASMAVALEARAPFLDPRIADFAWTLPKALVIDAGPKQLLREVLYRRVPRDLVDRPKRGFEPPLGRWLREGLRDWADELLSPTRLRESGIVDVRVVAARWAEHRSGRRNWSYPLWSVLMLEAWLGERRSSLRG